MGGWSDHVDLQIFWGTRGRLTPDNALWDTDLWDSTTRHWAGTDPYWIPLDGCEIGNITINRGRNFIFDAFGVGTAGLSLILTEEVSGGPVPADRWSWRSAMTIGDEIKITAVLKDDPDLDCQLYRGDIRSLDDKWSPYGVHLLNLNCTELSGRFGRINLLEQESQGAGETSGQRMDRISDHGGIPTNRRLFDLGIARLQATNMARNLAGEAEVTTASEGGDLYNDRHGNLRFRQRGWWQTDPLASEVQFTWANVDVDDAPPELQACPVTPNTRESLDLLANEVNLARAGGTVQTARDTASTSRWGTQTFARSDLMNQTDEDVATLAVWRLAETSQRLRLLDGLEVNPVGDPRAFRGICHLELGWLHRLVWDDGTEITDLPVHVQGINHRIGPETWTATMNLWDRFNYSPAAGWDIAGWDIDNWAAAISELVEV